MLVKVPRLLKANWVNERVSAGEWPLDHPFYCFTNSPCLRHLTAQSDPWGRAEREGGRVMLNSSKEGWTLLGKEQQTSD